MKLSLPTLASALLAAGLMASAHATPVTLSAVIDFEDIAVTPDSNVATRAATTSAIPDGVTTQYARFGLEFVGSNAANCSRATNDPACTAPLTIGLPLHGGRNFLMNTADVATGQFSSFSIRVLDGFALSTLKLDVARNAAPFTISYFDDADKLLGTPLNENTPSTLDWATVDLQRVDAAVRRIQFGGNPASSFAIDYMSFDYVTSIANVPEPTALSMVALALAGLSLTRRRQA